MNEVRAKKTKYLNNQMVSERELDWSGAKARLEMLRANALVLGRPDLNSAIVRMLVVINKNQPSKKILKSISKRISEIERELAGTNQRTK